MFSFCIFLKEAQATIINVTVIAGDYKPSKTNCDSNCKSPTSIPIPNLCPLPTSLLLNIRINTKQTTLAPTPHLHIHLYLLSQAPPIPNPYHPIKNPSTSKKTKNETNPNQNKTKQFTWRKKLRIWI